MIEKEDLDQQIEDVILASLPVEDLGAFRRDCLPKIMAIVEKYGQEMLFEFPPILGESPTPPYTSKEIGYLDNLTTAINDQLKNKL